ncbi:MAG: hypothetical protein QM493_09010 [Sulfurovum sp.]
MKYLLLLLISLSLTQAIDSIEIKDRYNKSYNYEKMAQFSEAIKVVVPIYNKYPKGYMINLRLGWLFYLNNKTLNSTKYYKQASLITPSAIAPKLGLIKIYLNQANFTEAELLTYNILKLDYYNYYGNYYTIIALIGEKKYDIAIEIIQKMLALYPVDIIFLEQLFIAYKATNNSYIETLYNNILTIDPNNLLINSIVVVE